MQHMLHATEQGYTERKRTLSVHQGRVNLTTTGANLLDTKYEFYGFNDDQTPLTNEYSITGYFP